MLHVCYTIEGARSDKTEESEERFRRLTSNSHSQSARLLVRRETDDVQPECDCPIDNQSNRFMPRHFRCAINPNPIQLSTPIPKEDALHEREWTHPHQQVERVKFESSNLYSVRDDRF